MRTVAIAVNPKTSLADDMMFSFWRQFETPATSVPAFRVPGRRRRGGLDFQVISPPLGLTGSDF
jgi:hypothetical protein